MTKDLDRACVVIEEMLKNRQIEFARGSDEWHGAIKEELFEAVSIFSYAQLVILCAQTDLEELHRDFWYWEHENDAEDELEITYDLMMDLMLHIVVVIGKRVCVKLYGNDFNVDTFINVL